MRNSRWIKKTRRIYVFLGADTVVEDVSSLAGCCVHISNALDSNMTCYRYKITSLSNSCKGAGSTDCALPLFLFKAISSTCTFHTSFR